MKKVLLLVMWLVVVGTCWAMHGTPGEQLQRDVAVQQVEDSELPMHAIRNFNGLRTGATVVLCGGAGLITVISIRGKRNEEKS